MISFTAPAVAPINDEEEEAFTELDELVQSGEPSKAIGWAISQGKLLMDERDALKDMKKRLQGTFHGRTCHNWAVLLFFVRQVS